MSQPSRIFALAWPDRQCFANVAPGMVSLWASKPQFRNMLSKPPDQYVSELPMKRIRAGDEGGMAQTSVPPPPKPPRSSPKALRACILRCLKIYGMHWYYTQRAFHIVKSAATNAQNDPNRLKTSGMVTWSRSRHSVVSWRVDPNR